jgi:hypothetical protein
LIHHLFHSSWRILTGAVLLLAVFLLPLESHADWINLTGAETAPNIAEITVLDDRVPSDGSSGNGSLG